MKNATTIPCPHCGKSIDVNNVLKLQIEEGIRNEFEEKAKLQETEFSKEKENLEKAKVEFEKKKKEENDLFAERLEKAKKLSEKEITEKLRKTLEDENKESFDSLQKELSEKSEKVKDYNKMQAQISTLQREKSEMRDAIKAESEKELNDKILEEKQKIRKQLEDDNELKLATLKKQLEDQKKLTEEMKRKQEQGSMQLQGEVLELALEDFLHQNFRWDKIEEVQKGTLGADVLQTVNNEMLQNCGKIIYETKRTKNFDQKWLDKLQQDQLNAKAEIAVLVTETLPKNIEKFDVHNGIWICSYQEVKSLVVVLRQILIETQKVKIANENRGDKMEILYSYFTSGEFSQKTKRILEIYDGMLLQLDSEKKVTHKLWAKREKDISVIKENLSIVSGDIAGITGKEINLLEEYDALILE
ncbi:DUF2130 domain-containing protein [Chryseobacterium sp. MDT2-18]|uniref:DUF2130 domain-containing protein n=1 Tax=Chryseobacterium sp. MDT2-18 TaxID=1259136 RepID=UPI00278A9D55|nr:DUF2130 domain-containing protein [Chryseobacterium sp. MDT2-18]MDQ0478152.1 hypothetical protein [Chryseobacterium sp. MDT2-18]